MPLGVFLVMLFIKTFRIGPVTSPKSVLMGRGLSPRVNTVVQGPVTGSIQNFLIHANFINELLKHLV